MTTAGPCSAGDALGVVDGDFAIVGEDLYEVACGVLERLLGGGGELVTLVAGAEAGDLAQACEALGRARPPGRRRRGLRGRPGPLPAAGGGGVAVAGVQVALGLAGRGRRRQAREARSSKATGVETVGDLLGHLPAPLRRKGSLSELEDLNEGDILSLVGEVVTSRPEALPGPAYPPHGVPPRGPGPRRGRQPAADLLRQAEAHRRLARDQELPAGTRRRVQRPAEVVQRPVAADQPRLADVRRRRPTTPRRDARPDPDLPLRGRRQHLAVRGHRSGSPSTWSSDIPEVLPAAVREAEELITADQALRWIHRPDNWAQKVSAAEAAEVRRGVRHPDGARPAPRRDRGHRRQPAPRTRRRACSTGSTSGCRSRSPTASAASGRRSPPSSAQGHPMHRLLQGEVGSGKTVVALRAMLQVVDSGGQAALLAPTEVLAQQHHRSIVGDARRPGRGRLPRRRRGRDPGRAADRLAERRRPPRRRSRRRPAARPGS